MAAQKSTALVALCTCIALAFGFPGAHASDAVDCPLRDAPYSLSTPLLDLLLNDQTAAIVNETLDTAGVELPSMMFSTTIPSFAAIVDVNALGAMAGLDAGRLKDLQDRLADVPVTDKDRQARCARYDFQDPELTIPEGSRRILIFDKITGFDHGPSVGALTQAIQKIAGEQDWGVAVTSLGSAFQPDILAHFDAVVWNNVSGDALTLTQRAAFEAYMESGGGFVGVHATGGDSVYYWDFYINELVGAHFIGHPMDPQFQEARISVETNPAHIAESLMPGWSMEEEWYSFRESPRSTGAEVVATLDEATYRPVGFGGLDLRMGTDHPIAWTRCVKSGRAFFSAIGHRPLVYDVPENMALLTDGLRWAAGATPSQCRNGFNPRKIE